MRMRARRGMTLMELVIGLAITGMMATAGAAAFTSIVDHRETVRKANAATERAAALREMIRSWILNGQVRVDIGGGPRGLSRAGQATRVTMRTGNSVVDLTPAKNSGDQVTIVTSAVNPSMMPNLSIRLYIDVDDNTPEKGLTMEYQPNPQSSLTRRMLDSTITTLTLEYLDGRTQRWIESSQAATIGNVRATRISFASSDSTVASRLLSIPITIGASSLAVRAQ
jgi:prepilin-type N-terminal cleavage/methylation domain-containing protein